MQQLAPVVKIAAGKLRGVAGRVHRFVGIPYAPPPVGQLRWRPPGEVLPWAGVRDATAFGPDSFQEHDAHLRGSGLSEDCLYLNVWTPDPTPGAGLPVMVWIHGNGYTRGSGSHRIYDGSALAAHGVVVVTVNYRLGLAGFLAHPQLSMESEHGSSGNYGLLDQVAALLWVQENIEAFGGAPSRVTVFGQSAGATCAHLLMASPLAEGFFAQAILHSPGSMRPMAELHTAEQSGLKLGESIEALRELPISQLWPMAKLLVPAVRRLASPRGLGPIIDGWVVQGDDKSNYHCHRVRPMPLLVGTTANEGRRLTERMATRTASDVRSYLIGSFGVLENVPQAYLPADDTSAPAALDEVVGDTQFNYGAWSIGREMLRNGGPVFRYRFDHRIPGCDLPPTHDDELPYAFGTVEAGNLWRGPLSAGELSETDLWLSNTMMQAWAEFSKTGAPKSDGLPPWPIAIENSTMTLDSAPRVQPIPTSRGLLALQNYFDRRDSSSFSSKELKEL